jgi:uncharacterized membrane protein YeaQ/YmgE (transglycosylase-associated protein family)
MSFVWMGLIGFLVGLVARTVLPGTQRLGLVLTAVLGIAGSFAAGYAGQAAGFYEAGQGAGFVGSVLGAMALLVVAGRLGRAGGA